MFKSNKSHYNRLNQALIAILAAGLTGCASIGSPGGGLYDETPPVLKNSSPASLETNVKKGKITMHFDENIKLDNAMEKLSVSPPQEKSPIIQSNAKTLTIELIDSLKPNTTYSIDLADAVQDNNEGNPLEGLSLLFSTGSQIDSMRIQGHLLNAADLEPITGAYVGVYSIGMMPEDEAARDSILLNVPFERASKTDAYGAFSILGCSPGYYRLYGLIDGNTNYRYDLTSESIAFLDTIIEASYDSTDYVLMAFNEGKQNRYLDDCSRPDSVHIMVRFAAHMDSLPQISFMESDGTLTPGDSLLIAEVNPTCDTLTYWIKDSIYFKRDTLDMLLSYLFTDTAGVDIPRIDTIPLIKPIVRAQVKEEKPAKKGRRKKSEGEANDSIPAKKVTYMTLKQTSGQQLEIGSRPVFEVSAPLDSLHLEMIHLNYRQDTLWVEMPFQWQQDSLQPRRYTVIADPHFTPGYEYQLVADSAAMHDIYGNPINRTKLSFKEKKPEEYAHLLFNIEGLEGKAFIQLLNNKDIPVLQAKVVNNQAKFVHVPAGTYFARIILDDNDNGKFDTGNYFGHIQPERVQYLNAKIQLRANWTVQQNWNLQETPILQQKLEEVKINKPKTKREKKSKNEEYLRKLGKL